VRDNDGVVVTDDDLVGVRVVVREQLWLSRHDNVWAERLLRNAEGVADACSVHDTLSFLPPRPNVIDNVYDRLDADSTSVFDGAVTEIENDTVIAFNEKVGLKRLPRPLVSVAAAECVSGLSVIDSDAAAAIVPDNDPSPSVWLGDIDDVSGDIDGPDREALPSVWLTSMGRDTVTVTLRFNIVCVTSVSMVWDKLTPS
jgi:hypothetical protein